MFLHHNYLLLHTQNFVDAFLVISPQQIRSLFNAANLDWNK
jgi:hypothetical protein